MWTTLRRKIAGKFGRYEHFMGELLGLALLIVAVKMEDYLHWVLFTMWLLYYVSHRLEKITYGRHGFR